MEFKERRFEYIGMQRIDDLMNEYFKGTIQLGEYWGPVQMCVFQMEYTYLPSTYKMVFECERGFITVQVINKEGKKFSPWMIYPNTNYYHFEDRSEDVVELVQQTYQAITRKEIKFLDSNEIAKLNIEFHNR